MADTAERLDALLDRLAFDMGTIKGRLAPGAKVTLIIRRPDDSEAGIVVSDEDNLHDAIAEIQRRVAADPNSSKPRCENMSPPWFTGRWRDWHRGHGCDKDDGKPRTAEGQAEIDAGGYRRV